MQAAPSIDLSHFIIFSKYIAAPITTLAISKIDSITNIIEMSSLSSTDIYDPSCRKFRLANKSNPASFSITSNCNILPFTVPFEKTKIVISKSCKLCMRDSMLSANVAEDIIDIKLKNWENNFQNLIFKFEDFSNLSSGIYLYEVILRPRSISYRLPKWIHEWNMNLETIDLIQKNPEIFNGATTLNLERFINDLWRINLEHHNPKIAILNLFLKKD